METPSNWNEFYEKCERERAEEGIIGRFARDSNGDFRGYINTHREMGSFIMEHHRNDGYSLHQLGSMAQRGSGEPIKVGNAEQARLFARVQIKSSDSPTIHCRLETEPGSETWRLIQDDTTGARQPASPDKRIWLDLPDEPKAQPSRLQRMVDSVRAVVQREPEPQREGKSDIAPER